MFLYRQNQKILTTEIKPINMFMNQKKLELGLSFGRAQKYQ